MIQSKTAKFWVSNGDFVECHLCPHNCKLSSGKLGFCNARKNVNGTLYTLNYGKISSAGLDPIEKKPLFNYFPGTKIFSVGSFGCNFKCSHCQNWTISQREPKTIYMEPEQLIDEALKTESIGIAFTYNEPSIWYEYVYDTSILARKHGLKNVLVTNGFINIEPLNELLLYIDAMNIDLKGYSDNYYLNICGGRLEDVKKTIQNASSACHVEITTLIIPSLNDNESEIEELCKWLSSIDRNISLHLSRYFPNYKMDKPTTPKETMYKLKAIADKYLTNVYLGNMF